MSPQEKVFRRGLQWSAIAIAIITVAACVIAYLVSGMPGLWSALAGAGLAAIFGLGTQLAALVTVRKDPLIFVAATAASSMAKILLVIVAAMIAQSIRDGRGRMPAFKLPDSTLTSLVRLVRLFDARRQAGTPGDQP